MLYLIGVASFAVSGVLAAARARMDLFGGIVLAFIAALSGGTLRDLLLDRRPLYWTQDELLLTVILAAGVGTLVYIRFFRPPVRALYVVDALGLAVVTVIGTQAALAAGIATPAVLMMGVITGATGEVIRDILCDELPLLLREDIYAIAALAGSVLYVVLDQFGAPATLNAVLAIVLVFGLRLVSMIFKLRMPSLPRLRG
ncbi:putative membrane protein YeiH [Tamaricihabitans halophyticus]|uniref:Putative membrane protein YeiH n=1 Tax=Tamaricihabitans halophyticus TaxID=1262583 RepID=A0A4R2R474_9PSEU|nr:putative membrane protein YeiH [Tamaricihabitans halophyticus]